MHLKHFLLQLLDNQRSTLRHTRYDEASPPFLVNGFLAFSLADKDNPRNWSISRRWTITISAVMLVMNATFASSSPSGCLGSIIREFNVSTEVAGLTITVFLLGYCVGPLAFAPLSELYGRRWIFYITFSMYLAFNFLCAFAPTFGSLVFGRFLTGTMVSAPMSNVPGVLADLWDTAERGDAMGVFSAMVWVGPALGPVIAGFLELKKDWRWSFYVLLWLGAGTWVLMLVIPETHGPTILRHKAERLRKAKVLGYEDVRARCEDSDRSLRIVYKTALTRPWLILLDPISLLCAIYMSVVYTLLYMLFSIYPIVFQLKRGWNAGVGQLPLIGMILGALLGSFIVVYDTHCQKRKVEQKGCKMEDLEPEDRLTLAMIGGVGFPITMFWLAWTAEFDSVPWIVPTLAGCFLATSLVLIFVSFFNYLIDTYHVYAASAIAANTIIRSACGAGAPLLTSKMFSTLGVGGGGSLIGGLAGILASIPFAFYRYGKGIRLRSKFAHKQVQKEDRAEGTTEN